MPRTGYFDEEENRIMSDSPVRDQTPICKCCEFPVAACECEYLYNSPICASPSIGTIRAVRTGIQNLFDTPISIGSEFSRATNETLLDESVLQKRMAAAFDFEDRFVFQEYLKREDENYARVMECPPTPMKKATKMGRGGGLVTAPVQIIYYSDSE